ncbi:MAG: molybdate ABC transporter substrate-binding protein [Romboutsia sp.]|uniref:molybdate ABC transporter substrate-binding protein n=1 Tax=Romboutsia sp. TaxID=1965302 RepID=UPI003F3F3F06
MNKKLILLYIVLVVILSLIGCESNTKNKIELNISAASSLKDSMIKIKEEYEALNQNIKLTINYGSSGSLKQQIENGAPCDLFISAGKSQIEELENKNILIPNTIKNLLKNELVMIAPSDSILKSISDIKKEDVKHIGIGYPESVPAGSYAYETLNSLNLENKIKNKLVYAKDVKEVLAWVQLGNVDAGFVYFTDTVNNKQIKIIENIKEEYHSKIIYPMAIIKDSKNVKESKKLQQFLLEERAKNIFKEYGYR